MAQPTHDNLADLCHRLSGLAWRNLGTLPVVLSRAKATGEDSVAFQHSSGSIFEAAPAAGLFARFFANASRWRPAQRQIKGLAEALAGRFLRYAGGLSAPWLVIPHELEPFLLGHVG
jgi:hypothetical protein